MYERILVPLDGSANAERVIPHVEAIAGKFGSRIVLFRAITLSPLAAAGTVVVAPAGPGPLVDPTPAILAEREEAAAYLEDIGQRLRRQGFDVQCDDAVGPPGEAILQRARELPADLIAMTTHGRTGLGRVIFGSVAQEVVHKAACPVLLTRPV